MLKKALLAAVAATALVASASAQTMDGTNTPTNNGKAEQEFAYECVVDKVTPPDHDKDPGYKVNVLVNMHRIINVMHTTKSGATYYRGAQYTNTWSEPGKTSFEDSPLGWGGTSKKSPQLRMLGIMSYINGKPVYEEYLYKGNDKKPVLTVKTTCHEVNA